MLYRFTLLFILLASMPVTVQAEDHPDRVRHDGVPVGKLTSGEFVSEGIYPGTQREYSVYVPAQYQADQPANLMVFMDGAGYARENGAFRVPIVFDNLIHQGQMPVTIAVFVNPGQMFAFHPGGDLAASPNTVVAGNPAVIATAPADAESEAEDAAPDDPSGEPEPERTRYTG